jgi:hypothetical protein
MDAFSRNTTAALNNYEQAIHDPRDRRMFNDLTERRKQYLVIRENISALLKENRRSEADAMCKKELLPAYESYKASGEALLELNMRDGQTQGRTIMTICTATQFMVAAVGVGLFVIGFILGLFGFSR